MAKEITINASRSEHKGVFIILWVKCLGELDAGTTYDVVNHDRINLNFSLLSDL